MLVERDKRLILFGEGLLMVGENVDDGSCLDGGGEDGVVVVVFLAVSADMFVPHGGMCNSDVIYILN